jgi:hypothetical protein
MGRVGVHPLLSRVQPRAGSPAHYPIPAEARGYGCIADHRPRLTRPNTHHQERSSGRELIGFSPSALKGEAFCCDVGILELTGGLEISYLRREDLSKFAELVQVLSARDKLLQPIDLMIVAFSVADPQCIGLLTFDATLYDNKSV